MNNYKTILSDLVTKYPFSFSSVIMRRYKDILRYLNDAYPVLAGHPISEYVYWELNGLKDFPECGNLIFVKKYDK